MKTVLNVKVDSHIKQEARQLAERMGISLSAAVNGFLRTFVQTQTLHVTASPRMTPYLEKIIQEAQADYVADRKVSPEFANATSAKRWLKVHAK